jgi:hypothetical protein
LVLKNERVDVEKLLFENCYLGEEKGNNYLVLLYTVSLVPSVPHLDCWLSAYHYPHHTHTDTHETLKPTLSRNTVILCCGYREEKSHTEEKWNHMD